MPIRLLEANKSLSWWKGQTGLPFAEKLEIAGHLQDVGSYCGQMVKPLVETQFIRN